MASNITPFSEREKDISVWSSGYQNKEICSLFTVFNSDFCFCFSDTPAHMYYLHTCCWVLNMFGIFFILAAHEHYSIDVVIAFYITSRLFLYYHTLANTLALKRIESRRSRVWFPLFWFFEEKVSGKVPNEYEWPLKRPAFLCSKQKSTWMIFLWKWDVSPFQCLWHTCNGDVKMLCSCKCWLGVFFIQPLIVLRETSVIYVLDPFEQSNILETHGKN